VSYTVSQKNVTLFIFVISLSNFIRFCYFLAETCPRKFETNTCTCPNHISFYVFVLYLVKTSDASERTQQRRPLLVRLLNELGCRTFFKSLFKLLTLQLLSENSRINLLPPKILNLYKFSVKMRISAAPDCCMIWSGLHQRVIDEAIDHVTWTAARLREN